MSRSLVRRLAVVVIFISIAVVRFGDAPSAASAQAPETGEAVTTTIQPTTSTTLRKDPTDNEKEMADRTLLVTLLVVFSIVGAVVYDRADARRKQLSAIEAGAAEVSSVHAPDGSALGGAPAQAITVTPATAVIVQDTKLKLSAKKAGAPIAGEWTFDPPGKLERVGTGEAAEVEVRAVGEADVTVRVTKTADSVTDAGSAHVKVLGRPQGAKVTFSVLGAGLISGLVAVVAVGGGISLAFGGRFGSEIATLLGVAVGGGVAGAATAARTAPTSSSSQSNSTS